MLLELELWVKMLWSEWKRWYKIPSSCARFLYSVHLGCCSGQGVEREDGFRPLPRLQGKLILSLSSLLLLCIAGRAKPRKRVWGRISLCRDLCPSLQGKELFPVP